MLFDAASILKACSVSTKLRELHISEHERLTEHSCMMIYLKAAFKVLVLQEFSDASADAPKVILLLA